MNPIAVTGVSAVEVSIAKEVYAQRIAAIDGAQIVVKVTTALGQQLAVDVLRDINALLKAVETSRKDVKAPVIDLGRKIDQVAAEFTRPLEAEKARLQGLLVAYETEQRRIAAEAEAKRQAEIRRQQEEERQKREQIQREIEEKAEAQRRAEQQAREATDSKARAEAIRASQEAAAQRAADEARLQQQAEAARIQQAELLRAPAPTLSRATGSTVREVWTFDVTDLSALYAARPDLVEVTPKRGLILALIREGVRDIPGLAIRKEVAVNAR